jgi:hypothetical protein
MPGFNGKAHGMVQLHIFAFRVIAEVLLKEVLLLRSHIPSVRIRDTCSEADMYRLD